MKTRELSTEPILIAGGAQDSPDIRYRTGFTAVDPVILLERCGKTALVVPMLEVGRAMRQAPHTTVFTPHSLEVPAAQRRDVAAWALALLKREKIRRVCVPWNFPAWILKTLEKNGIKVNAAPGALYPQRQIKSVDEIKKISQVQRAAVAAMKCARAMIARAETGRGGALRLENKTLTSERIKRAIDLTLLEHDCEAGETIVACGDQAVDPHERGSGPLLTGEAVVVDIFPRSKTHGYHGDITRTYVKGAPSAELRRLYEAVMQAQKLALSRIRPGADTRDIHEAVKKYFDAAGYPTRETDGKPEGFFHGTGHGLGLQIHEGPSLSLASSVLKPGHVVTVEPGLYYFGLGGVRIEDVVAVTPDGWQYVAAMEKKMEL